MYQKVKDNPELFRDTQNNALINHNTDNYTAAKARKRKSQRDSIELRSLRTEIEELKALIKRLINKDDEQ